jgi:Metal binding domain of Ada
MATNNNHNWPSARHFAEALQCPPICFSNPLFRDTLPAVDRLGMPLVTSGQFAYVYKLRAGEGNSRVYAVRCFRGYLGDREKRYAAIDVHLRNHRIPALAEFTYEPEGILVGGKRYPILSMEWVEGPTLDVYIREVLGKREVLLHLADEWVQLVKNLKDARAAHGDLQHGNIIVQHGQLRLVDFDGMFVPGMEGWTASELGHQHFQHPARANTTFDGNLDHFSALVIYLSLISVAHKPELWAEHHDENLIFTKADFTNPLTSRLFQQVRGIGPEHKRLADVLADAVAADPADVPNLLEFVEPRTESAEDHFNLSDLKIQGKTREAGVLTALKPRPGVWPSLYGQEGSTVPHSRDSNTVQTLFGSRSGSLFASATPTRSPDDILGNTIYHARELLRKTFLWWYWALYFILKLLGLEFFSALFIAVMTVAISSLVYGLFAARKEALKSAQPNPAGGMLPGTAVVQPGTAIPVGISAQPPIATSKTTIISTPPSQNGAFVANRTLGIFHIPNCTWAGHISRGNRVGFASSLEALNAGYRACKVCLP